MRKNLFYCLASLILFSATASSIFAQKAKLPNNRAADKQESMKNIDARFDFYKDKARQIWNFAEVGFKEVKSAALLQATLKENGFTIEAGVAGIPTAFVATFGSGSPVIGILAEYDALPGLSQMANPEKEVNPALASGHGCGHHLFGVASAAAGIELKSFIEKNKLGGTIKVFGTPAEEGGSGKVYMVREGIFKDVDIVMHWHPDSKNSSNPYSSLANKTAKFRFSGISAHAAGSPEKGRSALDAVEAMDMMANMMREHMPTDARMHYIITEGGKAPNVVPDKAEVYYYMRHPNRKTLMQLFDRLVKTAEGAALGTGTTMTYEVVGGVYELLPIDTLARAMRSNLVLVGGVTYTAAELEFGKKLQSSFIGASPELSDAANIQPYEAVSSENKSGGSTDVADVSWVVPTVGFRAATWIPGTPAHSWQAVACGGTDIGTKGMMVAAKTLTLMGIDLFTQPKLVNKAKEEWVKAKGKDFEYVPLIGNRAPALNYRD